MPRKKRLWSPDHYHHVVVRGNNRQTIFHNVADYEAFFRVLQYAYHKYSFTIVAYCVMSNHYHLLIRSPKVPLGKVMVMLIGVTAITLKRSTTIAVIYMRVDILQTLFPHNSTCLVLVAIFTAILSQRLPLWLTKWRTILIARIISTSILYLQTSPSLIQVFSIAFFFKHRNATHYLTANIARNMKANHVM